MSNNRQVSTNNKYCSLLIMYILIVQLLVKVNESRYRLCEVTPHFSTGQNLLKKYREDIDLVN